MALASDAVVIESAPALIVTVLVSVMPFPPDVSLMSKTNVYDPGVVGVPVNAQLAPAPLEVVGLSVSPGGTVPLSSAQ